MRFSGAAEFIFYAGAKFNNGSNSGNNREDDVYFGRRSPRSGVNFLNFTDGIVGLEEERVRDRGIVDGAAQCDRL